MNKRVRKLIKKIKKNLRKSSFYLWKGRNSFLDAQWDSQELRECLGDDEIFKKIIERIYSEEGFSFISPELEYPLQKRGEEKKVESPEFQ